MSSLGSRARPAYLRPWIRQTSTLPKSLVTLPHPASGGYGLGSAGENSVCQAQGLVVEASPHFFIMTRFSVIEPHRLPWFLWSGTRVGAPCAGRLDITLGSPFPLEELEAPWRTAALLWAVWSGCGCPSYSSVAVCLVCVVVGSGVLQPHHPVQDSLSGVLTIVAVSCSC